MWDPTTYSSQVMKFRDRRSIAFPGGFWQLCSRWLGSSYVQMGGSAPHLVLVTLGGSDGSRHRQLLGVLVSGWSSAIDFPPLSFSKFLAVDCRICPRRRGGTAREAKKRRWMVCPTRKFHGNVVSGQLRVFSL